MSLIEHAKSELGAINFGKEDTDRMIQILELFFDQWDSGGAVSVAGAVLARLISGQPLAPITGAESEWMECGPGVFQNIRCSSVFKQREPRKDIGRGGMHPYDIDNLAWDGKFPYDPSTKMPASPVMTVG